MSVTQFARGTGTQLQPLDVFRHLESFGALGAVVAEMTPGENGVLCFDMCLASAAVSSVSLMTGRAYHSPLMEVSSPLICILR